MPQLPFLDGYHGETVQELIAFAGKYRTDSIVLAFEQAMERKAARIGEDKLSLEERVILAIEALEREVNNGGYSQFFINTGEYIPIIVDALRRIGCPKNAEIAHTACEIAQKAPFTSNEIENGTWGDNEEREQAFSRCDERYFERPENIEECLFAYIVSNHDKIKT